jgi:hypothetical protein
VLLFPNVIAFEVHAFLALDDAELRLECVRAYNDFQTEFASADPSRLVPQMFLPFWDVEASLAEMRRCTQAAGGRVVKTIGDEVMALFSTPAAAASAASQAQRLRVAIDVPHRLQLLPDDHKVSFSITDMRDFAQRVCSFMLGNAAGIAEVIMSGSCETYPD